MNRSVQTLSLALLVGLGIFFSACGPATAPAANTATPSQTLAQPTTSTRAPTRTPRPTTPSEAATRSALENEFRPLCTYPHMEDISPDGKWMLCMADETVVSQEGTIWEIDYHALFGEERYVDTRIVHWSRDGHFLFFSPFRSLDGIRPSPENAIAFFRMDLATGDIDTILARDPGGSLYYVLSMSPTGRRLAYIPPGHVYDQVIIRILEMSSGEEYEISLDSIWTDAGWFSWSADGLELTVSALASGTGYYHLTYDVRTLELIDSQAFIPLWMQEYQSALQMGTPSPTFVEVSERTPPILEGTPNP